MLFTNIVCSCYVNKGKTRTLCFFKIKSLFSKKILNISDRIFIHKFDKGLFIFSFMFILVQKYTSVLFQKYTILI